MQAEQTAVTAPRNLSWQTLAPWEFPDHSGYLLWLGSWGLAEVRP